jgi:acetylornithine deacetylase/succinyl-diaminopimelate desuccinylase-like protein
MQNAHRRHSMYICKKLIMNKRAVVLYLTLIFALFTIVIGIYAASFLMYGSDSESENVANTEAFESTPEATATPTVSPFDGERAYIDVQTQVDMGPRTPGSEGHAQIREWMREELESAGWTVEVHETERLGHPIYNIIAKRGEESPQIILGAHYDTRIFADRPDPQEIKRGEPVPGANDGASGVAVLLELARTLPEDIPATWLVFFDAEDNGRIEGWDWILGSRAFVEEIPVNPQAVVIVDMIGDANLNISIMRSTRIKPSAKRSGREH